MEQEIRILLVDDHSLFRESLSRLLQAEPNLVVAGSYASIAEALNAIAQQRIDLVLLDYDLGDEQASGFLTQARRLGFEGRILMVTAGMTDADTLRVLEMGCSGIFLKHSPPGQLLEAIHKVMSGEAWLDPRAMGAVVAGAKGRAEENRPVLQLSARERTVLQGVFEGLTNKEIGSRLDISESSVKAVLQQLFDKTGVRTRSQLVRIALERQNEWANP
jgi:DNA-binding NarL/FixJ family response regulator